MKLLKNYGLSLVEILVAILLGMLIILYGIKLLIVQREVSRMFIANQELRENSNFLRNFLSREIAMTGYVEKEMIKNPIQFYQPNKVGTLAWKISYAANEVSDHDCFGKKAAIINNFFEVVNNSLYCNGQPILDHIENVVVLLGQDVDLDGIMDAYVDAINLSLKSPIYVIKFDFILRSTEKIGKISMQNFQRIDQTEFQAFDDGYLRKQLIVTVPLLNRMSFYQ